MKILAIETSCDETAIAVLESTTPGEFTVRSEALYSQAAKHAEFGGVYPNLAKREHQENLVPLTAEALKQAGMLLPSQEKIMMQHNFSEVRDEAFSNAIRTFLEETRKPNIDLIAVTSGPGLEPALWTGVSFAGALGEAWNIPVVGTDHMEGHIVSGLVRKDGSTYRLVETRFPVLALLISGGHTELVLMREWFQYELVGRTRDDAVGEAYDKVARLLSLPYPGGPEIERAARRARERSSENPITLPRPMINDPSCDFSFSGLKTAVLYKTRELGEMSEEDRDTIAWAFEDAACDVLVAKVERALIDTNARMVAVGGGVSANTFIRDRLTRHIGDTFPNTTLTYPDRALSGDNAIMIGIAAALRSEHGALPKKPLVVNGSQHLA